MSGSSAPDHASSRTRAAGASTLRALQTLQEGVSIATDALRSNKVRSLLTILGVAVGVSVVVTMAALITGIRSEVMVAFESAGPKNFMVTRFDFTAVRIAEGGRPPWWDKPELTPREATRIASLPAVDEALYMIDASANLSFEGRRVSNVMVRGSSSGWPKYQIGDFSAGRDFSDFEVQHGRAVAVLSPKLAEELFGQRDPISRRIRVNVPWRNLQEDFTVIGVFAPQENVFSGAVQNWAIIPYSASLKRLKASDEQSAIYVVPTEEATQAEAQDQVIAALRSMRGLPPRAENDFALLASRQIIDLFDRLTGVFFVVMVGLSSAGLMVGGVGVIGIMLISVTERTREIGIRKAVGATRREILWQFLVEAAFLTALGGAAGMLLGGAAAFGISWLTPLPARIPLWSVVVALGMATVTGMLFGLLPAWRAARLEPVAALRAE
jgi:putative ABC transport system permease protein